MNLESGLQILHYRLTEKIGEGGIESEWTANGELFWRLGDRWYVVQTTTGDDFTWTEPELAFEIPFLDTPGRSYTVPSAK